MGTFYVIFYHKLFLIVLSVAPSSQALIFQERRMEGRVGRGGRRDYPYLI